MDISLLSIGEAIQFAINEEVKAYNLYSRMSEKVKNTGSKEMFAELAKQEKIHQALLEKALKEGTQERLGKKMPKESAGISDYLVASPLDSDSTIQEAIIFAMKEEARAVKLYTYLRGVHEGTESEELFTRLVSEETNHKLKLEDEYEKAFMPDN